MDAIANSSAGPDLVMQRATIGRWLKALRPALSANWGATSPAPQSDIEKIPLKSHMEQRLLRDLHMSVYLRVDHEGGGEVQFEYTQVPPGHRLQALVSMMAAIGHRVQWDLGLQAYVDLLHGTANRLEHGG
jgi:hypothetical protein